MKLHWKYDGGDPSLLFFTELAQFVAGPHGVGFPLDDQAPRVLNLGCLEEDWCDRVRQQNPGVEVVGIDWRIDGKDAANPMLFDGRSFDLIVALGAIEHFGLGYYGDPKNWDGDSHAMWNVGKWLRPGGYCTLDVPWTPGPYFISPNNHWRCYNNTELSRRLVRPALAGMRFDLEIPYILRPDDIEVTRFYAGAHAPYEIHDAEPTECAYPFTYCALLLRKPFVPWTPA